jgi:hypothetical protein
VENQDKLQMARLCPKKSLEDEASNHHHAAAHQFKGIQSTTLRGALLLRFEQHLWKATAEVTFLYD